MKTLQLIHVVLVSLWLECQSVFVKVKVLGVDLSLHARVRILIFKSIAHKTFFHTQLMCVPLWFPLLMAILCSVEIHLERQQTTHVTLVSS